MEKSEIYRSGNYPGIFKGIILWSLILICANCGNDKHYFKPVIYHSCTSNLSGIVNCWGDNESGQLGAGDRSANDSIVSVVGVSDAINTTINTSSSCAVKKDGAVLCWGKYAGEGPGYSHDITPSSLTGFANGFKQISLGADHLCGVSFDGSVKCIGQNEEYQIGNYNSESDFMHPATRVNLPEVAVKVSAGMRFTCAIAGVSGHIYCWGANYNGQLGNGAPGGNTAVPNMVVGIEGAVDVSTGYFHSCAVSSDGGVWCWGANFEIHYDDGNPTFRRFIGIFGSPDYSYKIDPNEDDRHVPVGVAGISNATKVSCGGYHTCVVLSDGNLVCWGSNNYGQLGDRTHYSKPEREYVEFPDGPVVDVQAYTYHTCAKNLKGDVYCWGLNNRGQLGDGTRFMRWVPTKVEGF